MKRRQIWMGTIAAGLLGAQVLLGQEADAPAAPPEMAEMMAAVEKAATPGPEHERLARQAGNWEATMTMWQPDGTQCGSGTATLSIEPILGGRYVRMHFEGTAASAFGEVTYKAIGQMGYDNVTKKYVSIWLDDMSTRPLVTEGTAEGDVITLRGEYPDPLSGQMTTMQEVITFIDDSTHKYELSMPGPDGQMYRHMEINYTRK